MNKQRKVVITTTYNEMGIIIDTKAEEVAQPNLQPTCNQLATDCISRQQAIDALECQIKQCNKALSNFGISMIDEYAVKVERASLVSYEEHLKCLPSVQTERKAGEWVQVPRFEGDIQPDLECPFCKHKVGWWDLARYCAGCGAKLEGGAG